MGADIKCKHSQPKYKIPINEMPLTTKLVVFTCTLMTILCQSQVSDIFAITAVQHPIDSVFVDDNWEYLAQSKTDKTIFYPDEPNMENIFFFKSESIFMFEPKKVIDIRRYIWSCPFYQTKTYLKISTGFMKHFDNTRLFLKQDDGFVELIPGVVFD